ncbi:TauD/TfdA dioxygenase family protein, partial [Janthinobacterium sp.]|uniref:TauD/TfdA dioxygenase family protein n=1 Tax=Janthinobacterium sp. TaxID=1871054 RepID=UPI00293D628C
MSAVLASAPVSAHFSIELFDAPLGAQVLGLDLARPLSLGDFQRLHHAHLDHHVLVFRDQRITPQQQIDFSRRFGPLQIHVLRQFQLAAHPEILLISNIIENGRPQGLGDAGHFWHSDLSYKEVPSLGSMLHAQELPEEGGDTLFANMHLAWESLPVALRHAVRGARAEHSYLTQYAELRRRNPFRPALSQAQLEEVRPNPPKLRLFSNFSDSSPCAVFGLGLVVLRDFHGGDRSDRQSSRAL